MPATWNLETALPIIRALDPIATRCNFSLALRGIQSIITLIDSDLPLRTAKDAPVFTPDEVILTLHDENEQGRLFRMKPW